MRAAVHPRLKKKIPAHFDMSVRRFQNSIPRYIRDHVGAGAPPVCKIHRHTFVCLFAVSRSLAENYMCSTAGFKRRTMTSHGSEGQEYRQSTSRLLLLTVKPLSQESCLPALKGNKCTMSSSSAQPKLSENELWDPLLDRLWPETHVNQCMCLCLWNSRVTAKHDLFSRDRKTLLAELCVEPRATRHNTR